MDAQKNDPSYSWMCDRWMCCVCQVDSGLVEFRLITICPESTCLTTHTHSYVAVDEFPVLCLSCITNAYVVFRVAQSSFHMEMCLTGPGLDLPLPIWNSITSTAAPSVFNIRPIPPRFLLRSPSLTINNILCRETSINSGDSDAVLVVCLCCLLNSRAVNRAVH